mgnify:FL=1
MSRQEVLGQVERAVMSDRNQDYAPPEENFQRIADLWNVYLEGKTEITPYDTSIMMVLVKVARLMASPHLIDHLVDIAGYAACAGDVMPDRPSVDEAQQVLPLEPEVDSPAEDGGLPGDRAAAFEGNPGFLRDLIWYGSQGRKVRFSKDWQILNAVTDGTLVYV